MTLKPPFSSDQSDTSPTFPPAGECLGSVMVCDPLEAQIQWEHELVQRGIRRYRASLMKTGEDGRVKTRDLTDLEPGMVIASDLIGPMVARIREEQWRVLEAWEKPDHRKIGDGDWVLLCLPADTLAATTVLHALVAASDHFAKWTGLCLSLGTRLKNEYDYARWEQAEKVAAKDDPAHLNMVGLMRARNKVIDERVFRKWSKKAKTFSSSAWESKTRIQAGSLLLTYLVESNGWFEVQLKREGVQTVRILAMTEAGQRWIRGRHADNELLRPYLLPMICEPLDYAYVEVQ